jgi:hypothetical protein
MFAMVAQPELKRCLVPLVHWHCVLICTARCPATSAWPSLLAASATISTTGSHANQGMIGRHRHRGTNNAFQGLTESPLSKVWRVSCRNLMMIILIDILAAVVDDDFVDDVAVAVVVAIFDVVVDVVALSFRPIFSHSKYIFLCILLSSFFFISIIFKFGSNQHTGIHPHHQQHHNHLFSSTGRRSWRGITLTIA